MSQKYGNPSATYNIPLNSSENDLFRIGSAHLQHFLHINAKTDDWKPMMLKMHLELDDSPSIGEAEQGNIEHNNSINGLRQSVQQLEEEIKALKDALLQAKENDEVNRIEKAPDIDNNATQKSNFNKQAKNENKSSAEHNDTENVASASAEHHTNSIKPEIFDLRPNCVYIENFQCSDSSLEMAFCNIRKLANEMNVEIPEDSVIHIDVKRNFKNNFDYYVYFCNADIKEEFLKNRHFYAYNPETSPLRILDYSKYGIVDIKNFQSSDLSLETAYANVIEIAKKMGIFNHWELRDYIDHIDVFSTKPNFLTYSVRFKSVHMKNEFLRSKFNLKQFPETKSLEISDEGEHILRPSYINKVSTTVASANVIGVGELIGLSLATDDFKHIYVLNCVPCFINHCDFSLIVEFSSKEVKDEFLQKEQNSMQMKNLKNAVRISDINAKQNVVSIKYAYGYVAIAISFIGLATQLGCSFNSDQIQYFVHLSKFMEDGFELWSL